MERAVNHETASFTKDGGTVTPPQRIWQAHSPEVHVRCVPQEVGDAARVDVGVLLNLPAQLRRGRG